ncbi:hypothetical protein GWK47_046441 [Chionoecetes opilio]|uniref:Uncharacterized protein n=1 Tax=Chionoecetes opilio TaxID=41210 RepID=A0A8J5CTN0_CHIOP|nr:hypothetical protein GWK47_046441 [Chionoecetes opilio]
MLSCWVTVFLGMVIPPMELWTVTELLNSLQGVLIFCIFVANRSRRKHMKKKFPLPFKIARQLCTAVGDCCCQGGQQTCLAPLNSFTSQVSRKLSNSSVVSYLSTLTSSLKFSTSFSVSLPDNHDTKRPSVFEPDGGITVLSLKNNSVPPYENGNSQC